MSKWAFGILLIFYYKLPTYFVYFTVALTEICRLVALDTRLAKFYAIIFGVQLLNILVTSVLKAKYYKDKTTRFMCTFFYVAIFCLTFGLSFLDPSHSNIVIMIIPWAYTFVAYEMRRIYLHKICNEVLSVFKRLTLSIADKIVSNFILHDLQTACTAYLDSYHHDNSLCFIYSLYCLCGRYVRRRYSFTWSIL